MAVKKKIFILILIVMLQFTWYSTRDKAKVFRPDLQHNLLMASLQRIQQNINNAEHINTTCDINNVEHINTTCDINNPDGNTSNLDGDISDPDGDISNPQTLSHTLSPNKDGQFPVSGDTDWQSSNKLYLYAYSAYYDDRRLLYDTDIVVILGIVSDTVRIKLGKVITCGIFYNDSIEYVSKPYARFLAGRVFPNSAGIKTMEFIFWCPLQSMDKPPHMVSLIAEDIELAMVTVEIPPKPDKVAELLVCTKALYIPYERNFETIDIGLFIEWVEMNKILGVDKISIHLHSAMLDLHNVLAYYYSAGYVDVVSMGPIRGDHFVQPRGVGANDCIYRNMHSYRRIINIDPDEIIIPRYFSTLHDFLEAVETGNNVTDKPISNFLFKSKVFYIDQIQPKIPSNITFVDNIKYKETGNSKNIINVNACFKVSAHKCHVYIEGSQTINVPLEDAASYHYKTCETARTDFKPKNCLQTFGELITDNRMMDFRKKLQENVLRAKVAISQHLLNMG